MLGGERFFSLERGDLGGFRNGGSKDTGIWLGRAESWFVLGRWDGEGVPIGLVCPGERPEPGWGADGSEALGIRGGQAGLTTPMDTPGAPAK